MKMNDLVLVMDKGYPRGRWPLGRVVEVFPGKDGLVREVHVKTSAAVVTRAKRQRRGEIKATTTILKRPTTKLCRLELEEKDIDRDGVNEHSIYI